jgi:hypothetical protein
MPKGIPNKKPEESNGEKISKMEVMRRAIAKKGGEAKPLELQAYIKSKFGIEMSTDLISTYKTTVLKAIAKKNAIPAIPTADAEPDATPATKAPANSRGGFSLSELEAVKALADKIGATKVQQLATALTK